MAEKDPINWERVWYWPIGKERAESPLGQAVLTIIGTAFVVVCAAEGGWYLALGVVTGDTQGLLFTYSNAGIRAQDTLLGVALILLAAVVGVIRSLAPLIKQRFRTET